MRNLKFAGNDIEVVGNEMKIGDSAPEFTVLDNELNEVKLSDYTGKKIVLAVFPSVDTSVCAAQTRKFNEVASEDKDVVILTISMDLPFALGRFCAAEGIESVITTSDHRNADFGNKYGFLLPSLRLLARGTVIIDKAGIIKFVEYVPEVTDHPDYDSALETLKKI